MRCAAFITKSCPWSQFSTALGSTELVCGCRRLYGCSNSGKSIGNSTTYHTADCTAYASHHTKADAHVGKLTNAFILSCFFRHIIATFLLIGVALLYTFLSYGLRFNDHFLCFCLLFNDTHTLLKLCFSNIRILTEMQLFELFVLWITVRFDNCGHIKAFQLNTIIKEIRHKAIANICGKSFKLFINLKDIYGIRTHRMSHIVLTFVINILRK